MGNAIARPTATDGYVRVLEADFETATKKFEAQAAEIKRLTSALAQAEEESRLSRDKTGDLKALEAASAASRTSSLAVPRSQTAGPLSRSSSQRSRSSSLRSRSSSLASIGMPSTPMPCERTNWFNEEQTAWARKSVLQHSRRGTMYPKRSTQNSGPDPADAALRTSLADAFTAFIDDHAANPETAQSTVPITDVVRIFASEAIAVTLDDIRTQTHHLGITREDLCMDEFILLYDQLRVTVLEKEVVALCRSRPMSFDGEPTADPNAETCIFLGGACNPTTWRLDLAIPAFKAAGLPDTAYYNPQKDNWSSELVVIEAAAKRDADILLFVITDETRAVGSMIEVAEHATLAKLSGKRVVVVIQDLKPGSSFGDIATTPAEIKDLNRGRAYLADVCARQGFVVFQTVESGIEHTIRLYGDVQLRAAEVIANAVRATSEFESSEFESEWPESQGPESDQGEPVPCGPLGNPGTVPEIRMQSVSSVSSDDSPARPASFS